MDHNTSLNLVRDSMEKLQHRNANPLPPIPDLNRGTPNSVIAPVPVQPIEVLGPKVNIVKEIIQPIITNLRTEAGLTPEFNPDDALNKDGLEKFLADWKKAH